jgi:ABC-type multidrug transport system fused ATPase/permease subunit
MRTIGRTSRSSTTSDRIRRLAAQYVRPHRGVILAALAGMLAQSLLVLPVPLLQGRLLDRIVRMLGESGTAAQAAMGPAAVMIITAVAAMIACQVARTVLGWAVASRMSRVSLEVVREVTAAMHRKLQRLPMSYYDREQTGQVLARITGDAGSLLIFLDVGSLQLASDLILAAGITAVLAGIEWRLAVASLAVMPLYALNYRWFAGRVEALAREVRARLASIYALLSERVSAVRVVRSFAQEAAELAEFDARIDAHRAICWESMRAGARQGAAATALGGLGTVVVVAFGAVLVARGQLTVGGLLAVYGLVPQLYGPIVRLAGLQAMLAATRVAVDRMVEVLDEPEIVADRPDARPVRRPRGALAYRDVSFAYAAAARPVLQRIDLDLDPGMTLGLLGASGSGKSTALALAPRLYDLAEGQGAVLLDGQDVRGLRVADLRRAVCLVPQQAILFEGTIGTNLLYAAGQAPDAVIRRALEAVDLATTLEALPMGLETPVGERGLTLSGGQRQRLALARALVTDPAVLLMDDCTSALDAETEARIRQALRELRPGRTTVIVSHKLASVQHADLIVVLEEGRILEQGTHDSLLALGGLYARTFRQQARALSSKRSQTVSPDDRAGTLPGPCDGEEGAFLSPYLAKD